MKYLITLVIILFAITNLCFSQYKKASIFVKSDNGYYLRDSSWKLGIATNSLASDLTLGSSNSSISVDTQDGADNKTLGLSGGGSISQARGAMIKLYGNEHTNAGLLELRSGNVAGSRIVFYVWGAERARLTQEALLIGTTSVPTGNIGKVIMFGDNVGDPTPASGTAGLYAKSVSGVVEMFAIGSDGLMNQISSHHPKTKELYHYSIDAKTGKHIQIDVERLAKWIDEHFGTNFVREWYEPKKLTGKILPRDSFIKSDFSWRLEHYNPWK